MQSFPTSETLPLDIHAAVAHAKSVPPTWGSGWSVTIGSGQQALRTSLASVEQVLALGERLSELGYEPVVGSGPEFVFRDVRATVS